MTSDLDVKAIIEKVGQNLNVARAFGPPVERDGTLVIPVAFVAGGGGTGRQPESKTADPKAQDGAGFGGVVYPVGVYLVRQGEVRFKPSWDANLLALLGFLFVSMLFRRGRRRRQHHSGS